MATVLDLKGKQVGDLKLSEHVFAKAAENEADNAKAAGTMHAALVRQLSNARVGSANSKTRAEVRGGGAKPWRQKGTGRARAGSRRSPLWAGGGVTFGPKPRDYSSSMPTKMRHSAIKSALSIQADNLVLVNDFSTFKEVKTKDAAKILEALKIDEKRILVVVEPNNADAQRFGLSVRNMKNVTVVRANNIGVKELLNCEAILTSQSAIEFITKWLNPTKKEKAAEKKSISHQETESKSKTEKKVETKVESKTDTKAEVKTKPIEKVSAKAEAKPSALQSIATTSKSKTTETPNAKKEDSSVKPKKSNDEEQSKGKNKGKGK